MKTGLDWRGAEKVEDLCRLTGLGEQFGGKVNEHCVTILDNAIRPVINPANPCDYREEARHLLAYQEAIGEFSFLYDKDYPLMQPEDKIEIIKKIAAINKDVIAVFVERMIQGCECRKKPIVRYSKP